MAMILWTWLGVTAATALVWLMRHRELSRAARIMPSLQHGSYADAEGPLPSVSFLVAAKDEAANIETCLRSMLRQDYPELQFIAVNDRSSDDTGAIMDRVLSGHARAVSVHVTELREGWFGKNNAMREGLARATGEWLCFTDADCEFISPRTLRIAMHHAREKGADFLSVLPAHETNGFWESVVQPACSGIMMIWFNPMRVNDPMRRTAYANGAFMLMRRSCYKAIGGHDAVKTELNEDMHMARRAKQAGQRLAVVSNVDLYTVRMYDSFAQTRAGWSRIFYGCFGTLGRLLATGLAVGVFSLLPWAAAIVGLIALAGRAEWSGWPVFSVVAAATCIIQWTVMLRFYKLNRLNPLYGIAYPLGALVGLGAVLGAIRRLGGRRTITWRGTTYRGGAVTSQAVREPSA